MIIYGKIVLNKERSKSKMNEMNNRYYDENMHGNIRDYRDNYRDDYRDYRDDYNYRRGGRRNYRNYRNYREEDFYGELDMVTEDMREQYRRLEDVAQMSPNMQDKNIIMKIAEKEKENYHHLKQLADKQM